MKEMLQIGIMQSSFAFPVLSILVSQTFFILDGSQVSFLKCLLRVGTKSGSQFLASGSCFWKKSCTQVNPRNLAHHWEKDHFIQNSVKVQWYFEVVLHFSHWNPG